METDQVSRFAGANARYYHRAFAAIQSRSGPVFSFNPAAAVPPVRLAMTVALAAAFYGITLFARIGTPPVWLTTFPADVSLAQSAAAWFDAGFDAAHASGQFVFDGLRNGIRTLVEALEPVLVGRPWAVIMLAICTFAWQMAGLRIAIFTAAVLAYLALFGFWDLSMQTVALLGAASILYIAVGIPLGIWVARSRTAIAVAQPVLDFMQTMPAFVCLIPVIAFFGTGRPPGIIATLIFGMSPVIRLTTPGLTGVAMRAGSCPWSAKHRPNWPRST